MPVPVISVAQMREWEQAAWAGGRTQAEVIRRAGAAVAARAQMMVEPGERILVLAGKGHNGDDARQAFAQLPGENATLLDLQDPVAEAGALARALAARPAIIIDGLFGIGLNRPLDQGWSDLIQRINEARIPVLAIDAPSGLNADTGRVEGASIRATVTLTLGAAKRGLLLPPAWPWVGRLEVAPEIGLGPCAVASEALWTLPEDFGDYPPPRMAASHKGDFGRLAIVAGSLGYHGAAVLTSHGAQRARPGLITLFTSEAVYAPVAAQLQAVMVSGWRSLSRLPTGFDAILAGPGLAAEDISEETRTSVRDLWRSAPVPVVMDASALDWLLPAPLLAGHPVRVITPHPGEAGRLLGVPTRQVQDNRQMATRELSRRLGNCWVVLKGHQTLIGRATGEIYVNSTGSADLAQGGSGDLLSGFIAGLLAQPALQADPQKAILYAVWEHGAAADRLSRSRRNWVIEDLAAEIGRG